MARIGAPPKPSIPGPWTAMAQGSPDMGRAGKRDVQLQDAKRAQRQAENTGSGPYMGGVKHNFGEPEEK